MKNKFIRIISCFIISLFLLSITSCGLLESCKLSLINEVTNEYIDYSQNITVSDIEEALVVGSEIAKSSSIGVRVQSKSIITTSQSSGSAVIIKRIENKNNTYKYFAVTNRHVTGTKSSNEISVYLGLDELGNKRYIEAELVVYDSTYDLALITFTTGLLLNVATVNTETPKVGSFAIAVGSPYDLEGFYNTVTIGSISAVNRVYNDEDVNGNVVQNTFIQHDAALNSGNSGGGLFDIYGRLIGINTWKIAGSFGDDYVGLNFSIPIVEVINRFSDYM